MTNDELNKALEALVSRAAVLNGTKWQGTWNNRTSYASRDLVFHGGKTYMSLVNQNTNNNPASKKTQWNELSVSITKTGGGGLSQVVTGDGLSGDGSSGSPVALDADSSQAINFVASQAFPEYGVLRPEYLPPDFTNADVYVSPDGNDNTGDGSRRNPLQHIYNGLVRLRELGGGTLHCADWCEVGGPVAGQGIWLRSDWIGPGGTPLNFNVPGFIKLDVPIKIVGHGRTQAPVFGYSPTTEYVGGGSTQFLPALWLVGSKLAKPFRMENMQSSYERQQGVVSPRTGSLGARLWVDWDRKPDTSIVQISVTNATRTGTSTVLTLDMNTVPSITVTRASRLSNTTTLTIPNPGIPFPPWHIGQVIRVASGDASFASGDYTLTNISDPDQDSSVWTVSYTETAANVAIKDVAGTSLKSHGCNNKELLWLSSNNASFSEQQYYVTSHTANTVTVLDNMTAGNANQNNIGTIAHQERYYVWSSNVSFERCSQTCDSLPLSTHAWDIGSHLALAPTFKECWMEGSRGLNRPAYDHRAFAAMYAYGGCSGAVAVELSECRGTNGAIFMEASAGPCILTAVQCLIEQDSVLSTKPGLLVWGNEFTSVKVHQFTNADGLSGAAWVELVGVPYSGAIVTQSGPVKGACVGGDAWNTPGVWSGPSFKNPWAGFDNSGLQVQTWAGGRITGKHPGANRAMGVLNVRYKNFALPAANWTAGTGVTITSGGGAVAPDGMPSDLVQTSGIVGTMAVTEDGQNGAVVAQGGRFVCGAWVNASSVGLRPGLISFQSNQFATVGISNDYRGTGWQWVCGYCTVGAVSLSPPNFFAVLEFGANATVSVYGLTLVYFPPDIDINDVAESAGTFKHQPRYLLPGAVGTMEGQKFYAHGGIGGASRNDVTLDASPNGIVVPYYNPATGNLLGYLPLYDEA